MSETRKIELLAPARDAATAIEAIRHGADAVYMGATSHGARALAVNTLDDIRRVTEYAHQFLAKVYVTVNTLVYDSEIAQVEKLVHGLYDAHVDALIVQDMSLLRMNLPPIALHASTQCDIRTPEKARFLQDVGFSQLVLARELTLNEIADISRSTSVPLEAFVHGALCVSYSGRCQVSQALHHRSANRGECAQVCRYAYDLCDETGNVLLANRHLLSLRDLNQSDNLEQMIYAGISSFKIEGRLKDVAYVKNVVAHYHKRLNEIIASRPGLTRASAGQCEFSFTPSLNCSFNRGFTHYFLDGRNPENGTAMASTITPKSLGEYIGKLLRIEGNALTIGTDTALHNGDGLLFHDGDTVTGARVNVAEGNRVRLRNWLDLKPVADVWRNFNKEFEDTLATDTAVRTLSVNANLNYDGSSLRLTLADETGISASVETDIVLQKAHKEQTMRQSEELAKLGGTVFSLSSASVVGEWFIPMSVLARMRRECLVNLINAKKTNYTVDVRLAEDKDAVYPAEQLLSADNVANSLAADFYRSHGVTRFEPAMEVNKSDITGKTVMHTRYCLRRELGACLKTDNAKRLPGRLFLKSSKHTMEVICDCSHCEMKLQLSTRKE